ncbi:hypothetical protein [Streptomyces lydicamycinicus]|uniref:hypothetical protein n=1 Tax=Streptomyces lydicamycinicus TaxID=1546107 RepID=UPI003C2F4EB9
MADDRLTEIAARAAAATPGPWTNYGTDLYRSSATGGFRLMDLLGSLTPEADNQSFRNASFVAAAREDVPWLLAQLEQARAIAVELENENARLRAELEQHGHAEEGGAA